MTVLYRLPSSFIAYDPAALIVPLIEAKSAISALANIPYQKSWAEALQEIELKREVAGTSKIEGADFTEVEFEEAVASATDDGSLSRSQKQARAAINTYKWIATIEADRPITPELLLEMHRRIVTGCDDDHCRAGTLRPADHNVTFGRPRHRGASGGGECSKAFQSLIDAIGSDFRYHDSILQALAAHYHIGAIHPFEDGNGRTARALEALLLRRSDLRDTLFIAMSNYYYDEKDEYLKILSNTAQKNHDLTDFFAFSLHGLALQCNRLLKEIKKNMSKVLFIDTMNKLYGRLQSTRKRVLAARQVRILQLMLEMETVKLDVLRKQLASDYDHLTESDKAFVRDINNLSALRAITVRRDHASKLPGYSPFEATIRLSWPMEISETEFFSELENMPRAKTRLISSD